MVFRRVPIFQKYKDCLSKVKWLATDMNESQQQKTNEHRLAKVGLFMLEHWRAHWHLIVKDHSGIPPETLSRILRTHNQGNWKEPDKALLSDDN